MLTVASPLMSKELAKFPYLLMGPGRGFLPCPYGISVENDVRVCEVTAFIRPPRLVMRGPQVGAVLLKKLVRR